MFRFNYQKLRIAANNNDTILYNTLCQYAGVKSRFDKIVPKTNITIEYGYSYISNLKQFLEEGTATIEEITEYIRLASYRSYFNYVAKNDRTLEYIVAEALGIPINTRNPLIRVANNKIYFKFEEEKNGTKF